MADETFLPETTMKVYGYRGAYGQQVAGPWADSLNPGVGCCGMAGLDPQTKSAIGTVGLIAGSVGALMALGGKSENSGSWFALMAAGIGAYLYSREG